MRAREIFEAKEADVPEGVRDVIPPSMVVHDLDGNYELYRLLISVAGMPDQDTPLASVTPDKPYFAPYTDQEREHVEKLLAKMKKHPTHLSNKKSSEPDFVNKVSPVRKFKDLD